MKCGLKFKFVINWKPKNSHPVFTDVVHIVQWLWNFPGSIYKNSRFVQPLKLDIPEESNPSNFIHNIIFYIFLVLDPLLDTPKEYRFNP